MVMNHSPRHGFHPAPIVSLLDRTSGLHIFTHPSQLVETLTSLIMTTESQVHAYRKIDRALHQRAPGAEALMDRVFGPRTAPQPAAGAQVYEAAAA